MTTSERKAHKREMEHRLAVQAWKESGSKGPPPEKYWLKGKAKAKPEPSPELPPLDSIEIVEDGDSGAVSITLRMGTVSRTIRFANGMPSDSELAKYKGVAHRQLVAMTG